MKIYTKTGDLGETGLIGNVRVSKSDPRVQAYGVVDELNALIGILKNKLKAHKDIFNLLTEVQSALFSIGSQLASEKEDSSLLELNPDWVNRLEMAIDEMDKSLPSLKNFILPGGVDGATFSHWTRTVCRRAEREVVGLNDERHAEIIVFLNRLSDYFFVLARYLNVSEGYEEEKWQG